MHGPSNVVRHCEAKNLDFTHLREFEQGYGAALLLLLPRSVYAAKESQSVGQVVGALRTGSLNLEAQRCARGQAASRL